MDQILNILRGPVFIFCFAAMILGLIRTAAIILFGAIKSVRNAGDKNIPYNALLKETLEWLIPLKHLFTTRGIFSVVSFAFHVGLVVVPLLLLDHILLWRDGFGISWPSIPQSLADALTLISIVTGSLLLLNRILDRNTRFLSGILDYLLILLILAIFVSGHIASKPFNPLSYEATMLIHVASGDAILLLIPFTKLAHCLLYPLLRIASNIAWHFPGRGGEAVNQELYGEETRKI